MEFEQNLEEREKIFFVCEIHKSNAYRVFSGNQDTKKCPHCGSFYFERSSEALEDWINSHNNQLKGLKLQLKNPIRFKVDSKRRLIIQTEILKVKNILNEFNRIKNG